MINTDNLKQLTGPEEHELMAEVMVGLRRGLHWMVKRTELIVQHLPTPTHTVLGIKVRFAGA